MKKRILLLDHIKEFLNDRSNFNNIKYRSEADLQFEIEYFLRSKKEFDPHSYLTYIFATTSQLITLKNASM